MNEGIKKAIDKLGSRQALASFLECGAAFVSQLEGGTRHLPIKKVGPLAEATGIPRHELRPDIFPEPMA